MIDLSDGLSSDLGHILDESGGLGAILDAVGDPDPSRCARREPPRRHLRPGPCAQRRRGLRALPDASRPRTPTGSWPRPPRPAVLYRIGEVTDDARLAPPHPGRTIDADRAAGVRPSSGPRTRDEGAAMDVVRPAPGLIAIELDLGGRDRAPGPSHRGARRAGDGHRPGRPAGRGQDPAGPGDRRGARGRSRRRSRAPRSS